MKRVRRPLRAYRATVSSVWYDAKTKCAREYEQHFRVARRGKIRNVRQHLAKRGVPYFQRTIYRLYKRWIPRRKIKIQFEKEQRATRVEPTITIESRSMTYKGKQWKAIPLPSRTISYAKRRRKK
jgi:hypothetical protein